MSEYSNQELRAMRQQARGGGFFLVFVGLILAFTVGFIWLLVAGLGFLFVLSSYTPDN
jgi:hypothetical protein